MAILPLQPDLAITSALVHRPMCVMRTAEAKVGGVTGRVGSLPNRCVAARTGLPAERPIPESTAPPQLLSRQVIFSDGLGANRRALLESDVSIRMRLAPLKARDGSQQLAA